MHRWAREYTAPVTSSNRRERQLARAKYERQQVRREQAHLRRRRNQRITAVVVVVAVVAAIGGWLFVSRSSEPVADPTATLASATPSPVSGSPVPSASADAPSEITASATTAPSITCAEPGSPRPDDVSFTAAPTGAPTGGTITLATNCGDIVISTLPDLAPKTVASEEFLAAQGFYDNTACHRVTTAGIFVLQCGDPAGNGTGGPGYSVPDENLPAAGAANYPAGTVAMANAGPGTAGSQFFIVYDDTSLPGNYTIWGKVTEGLDLVRSVAQAGVQGGGTDGGPAQPVFIESAKVSAG